MSKNAAVSKIKNAVGRSDSRTKELGAITMWTFRDVKVKADVLYKMYERAGIDPKKNPELYPRDLVGSVCFHKTLRELRAKTGSIMVRPIDESSERIIIGLVREDRDRDKADLDYEVEAKVKFKKDTESVTHRAKKGTEGERVAKMIVETYDALSQHYISIDLSRMMTKIVTRHMGSVCLRSTGGVYFTPAHHVMTLEKLQSIFNQLGATDVTVIPIFGDDRSKSNLGRQTQRALHEELAALQKEIEDFKAKTPRSDTLQNRVVQYKALKKRCDMYASMLSIKVDDIKTGIDDCGKAVQALLGVVEAKKAERKGGKRSTPKDDKKTSARRVRKTEDTAERKPAKKKATKKAPAKKRPARKKTTRKKAPAKKKRPTRKAT